MKSKLLSIALALLFLPAASAASQWQNFKSGGVSFSYPAQLGAVKSTTVAATPLASPDDKPDGVWPKHQKITFANFDAHLIVFPTTDAAVADFAKKFPTTVDAAKELKELLGKKPAAPKDIPFLPWADESNPFELKPKYISTKDFTAIRYLAPFQQEPNEVTSGGFYYAVQGLTKDSGKYIAFYSTLRTKALPEQAASKKWNAKQFEAFEKRFPQYIKEVSTKLNAQGDGDFTPTLTDLDKLVNSISITQ